MLLAPKVAVLNDIGLAKKLDLAVTDLSQAENFDFLLIKTPKALELHQVGKNFVLAIDFLDKSLLYRKKKATCNNEALAKAVGLKANRSLNIIDATAGLGKDAFILASLGANVTLIERSLVVAALLQDALERAQEQVSMKLVKDDAIKFLTTLKDNPTDVIYLDPMYPQRSSAVKKDIKMLQMLLGSDQDEGELLNTALACAKRVVLKRPNWANLPTKHKPHMIISTPNHYFAVYINHKL